MSGKITDERDDLCRPRLSGTLHPMRHVEGIRGIGRLLVAALSELLAPTRCVGCDELGTLLCPDCERKLPLIDTAQACPFCGAPDGRLACTECVKTRAASGFSFSGARAAVSFQGVAARLIVIYKDGGERRLAPILARLLALAAGEDWRAWADCIVFVPARPSAYRRRGFDHMQLVAEHLGRALRLPVCDALICGRQADQRGLSSARRWENMAGAFTLTDDAGELLTGRRALIVDDVFTTGATLSAASDALLEAGAVEVRVVVVGRVW
jgi:ComF family protein